MLIHAKTYGHGPALMILHGLLGCADNWHNVAKSLGERFQVFALDMRNHGRSFHAEEMDCECMAADLLEFMDAHSLPSANLLGHSMGGKAAMTFALKAPSRVDRLIVVDIAPRAYPQHHGHIFQALKTINLDTLQNRRQADSILAQTIAEKPLRQFLLKNLFRKPDGSYAWRFNLATLQKHYADILAATTSASSFPGPALFVRGEQSSYIQDDDLPRIRKLFPAAACINIPRAGHWVHADNPPCFLQTVRAFLIAP